MKAPTNLRYTGKIETAIELGIRTVKHPLQSHFEPSTWMIGYHRRQCVPKPVHPLHVRGDNPEKAWGRIWRSVHLHLRGDSTASIMSSIFFAGSSPRAWRQLLENHVGNLVFRFISTCVETAGRGPLCRRYSSGSSPRAWRQLQTVQTANITKRFISTCVETACNASRSRRQVSVHLHVRGDSQLSGD